MYDSTTGPQIATGTFEATSHPYYAADHANPSISLIDILESAYDAGLADGSLHSDGTFFTWLSAQVEGGALKLEIT